jgi:hypothetical protein
MDTTSGWHAAVAAAVFLVLVGWTAAVNRMGAAGSSVGASVSASESAEVWLVRPFTRFMLMTVAASASYLYLASIAQGNGQEPQFAPVAGWSVLAAGSVLAATSGRAADILRQLALATAAVSVLAVSYRREGGWPGVAGWEFGGMQSPILLSTSIGVIVCCSPLIGGLAGALGQLSASRVRAHHNPGTAVVSP